MNCFHDEFDKFHELFDCDTIGLTRFRNDTRHDKQQSKHCPSGKWWMQIDNIFTLICFVIFFSAFDNPKGRFNECLLFEMFDSWLQNSVIKNCFVTFKFSYNELADSFDRRYSLSALFVLSQTATPSFFDFFEVPYSSTD